ncbi:MAG TPA: hypothetical protein VF744_13660 [Beijerinckiaceae bacterium]|jgi:hypothetical protein
MTAASRDGRSGSKGSAEGAAALDYVKTQRAAEAKGEEKAARAKASKASKGAPAGSGDSPKRQGDKLEKARDAAAGRSKDR